MSKGSHGRGISRYRRNRRTLLAQDPVKQGPAEGLPRGICYWSWVEGKPHAISDDLRTGHPRKATADHYVPRRDAPKGFDVDGLENLVPACSLCNTRRQARGPGWNRPPGPNRTRDW